MIAFAPTPKDTRKVKAVQASACSWLLQTRSVCGLMRVTDMADLPSFLQKPEAGLLRAHLQGK